MGDSLRPLSFEKLMAMLLEEYSAYGTVFGVKDFYKAGRARLPIFGIKSAIKTMTPIFTSSAG